jgi:hypothetical protein
MKKFIISEDEKRRILNLHEGFKKGILSEQITKVEGPFKDLGGVLEIDDIYIMKHEKSMCRRDKGGSGGEFRDEYYLGQIIPMTGATCGEGFTTIPGGKFYLYSQGPFTSGKLEMLKPNNTHYENATNMGQGYNTAEEAKKVITVILNPKGYVGRQVVKGTDAQGTKYKEVTKYDKEGTVQKGKLKMVTSGGTKSVQRTQSGL